MGYTSGVLHLTDLYKEIKYNATVNCNNTVFRRRHILISLLL